MNRRDALKAVVGVMALGLVGGAASVADLSAPAALGPLGLMTVARADALRRDGVYFRALLDGRDVTSDCFVADDVRGYVGLHLRNAQGKHYAVPHACGHLYKDSRCRLCDRQWRIASEIRHGVVTFIEGAKA